MKKPNNKYLNEFYENQIIAGNSIYERFVTHEDRNVLLTAATQSGKTGVVIYLLKKAYDEGIPYDVILLGPSDRVLKEQTADRVNLVPEAAFQLLGSQVWHAGDIYPGDRGTGYVKLVNYIKISKMLGRKILVVFDEAHIGIGANLKKETLQKIPEFFEDICESLPGISAADDVQYLFVTATPFTYDTNQKSAQFSEVYLHPGPGYVGFRQLIDSGRILPNIERSAPSRMNREQRRNHKKQSDESFVNRFSGLLSESFIDNKPGYFVCRCTSTKDLRLIERAATKAGIPHKIFESKAGNIAEFDATLRTIPDAPKLLIIKQSYKQGKTLFLDHVVAWYENATSNGRNDADICQSVGRVCGYDKAKNDFPIYCPVGVICNLADYYEKSRMGEYEAKRSMPLSSTHTKFKITTVSERDYQVCHSYEQAIQVYKNWFPDYDGVFVMKTVSGNNSYDVLESVRNKTMRQVSATKVRIIHVDKPNKNYIQSFNEARSWWGKYIVLYETGTIITNYEARDKSYLNARALEAV